MRSRIAGPRYSCPRSQLHIPAAPAAGAQRCGGVQLAGCMGIFNLEYSDAPAADILDNNVAAAFSVLTVGFHPVTTASCRAGLSFSAVPMAVVSFLIRSSYAPSVFWMNSVTGTVLNFLHLLDKALVYLAALIIVQCHQQYITGVGCNGRGIFFVLDLEHCSTCV